MDESYGRARTTALRMLARREHACAELARKLLGKGYCSTTVEGVVAALAAERLVSDERFAEALVRSRTERGYGPVRILHELKERGVERDCAETAVDTRARQWLERAEGARRKRFGDAAPEGFRERGRQARFLEGRGFSAEHIRRVLDRAGQGPEQD